jgi:transcriptional regulator with XRE-family HTH domain
MSTKAIPQLDAHELLRRHKLHGGVYERVAKKLGIDASYVSRVASGQRTSERILRVILNELRRIERR